MVRVFVVYESQPDPERYERHTELCRRIRGATFRHGRVLRTIHGAPELGYCAAEMGIPHSVYLASVE